MQHHQNAAGERAMPAKHQAERGERPCRVESLLIARRDRMLDTLLNDGKPHSDRGNAQGGVERNRIRAHGV